MRETVHVARPSRAHGRRQVPQPARRPPAISSRGATRFEQERALHGFRVQVGDPGLDIS